MKSSQSKLEKEATDAAQDAAKKEKRKVIKDLLRENKPLKSIS